MMVRGYYEVYVSDEEVDIDNKEEIIEMAKVVFANEMQDGCVHEDSMTWEVEIE